jgi:hypothetical protein
MKGELLPIAFTCEIHRVTREAQTVTSLTAFGSGVHN